MEEQPERHASREENGKRREIAHCRNARRLGRVTHADLIENLNISTEMLLNEKLPSQV